MFHGIVDHVVNNHLRKNTHKKHCILIQHDHKCLSCASRRVFTAASTYYKSGYFAAVCAINYVLVLAGPLDQESDIPLGCFWVPIEFLVLELSV